MLRQTCDTSGASPASDHGQLGHQRDHGAEPADALCTARPSRVAAPSGLCGTAGCPCCQASLLMAPAFTFISFPCGGYLARSSSLLSHGRLAQNSVALGFAEVTQTPKAEGGRGPDP